MSSSDDRDQFGEADRDQRDADQDQAVVESRPLRPCEQVWERYKAQLGPDGTFLDLKGATGEELKTLEIVGIVRRGTRGKRPEEDQLGFVVRADPALPVLLSRLTAEELLERSQRSSSATLPRIHGYTKADICRLLGVSEPYLDRELKAGQLDLTDLRSIFEYWAVRIHRDVEKRILARSRPGGAKQKQVAIKELKKSAKQLKKVLTAPIKEKLRVFASQEIREQQRPPRKMVAKQRRLARRLIEHQKEQQAIERGEVSPEYFAKLKRTY